MAFNEIESSEQEETPMDEVKHHSGKFLETALKMKKEKKVSAKAGSKHGKHHGKKGGGGGKSFGKSGGK